MALEGKLASVLRLAALAGLFLILATPSTSHADPRVDEGRRLYEDLEYRKALRVLGVAAAAADLAREDRIVALQYLGLCQATLNDLAGAAGTFKRLLEIDPDFTLDRTTTPRVLDLFERVKSTMPRPHAPVSPPAPVTVRESELALVHTAPASAQPGRGVDLSVTLSDPERRAVRVVVRYRAAGQRAFSEVTAVAGEGAYRAQISGLFVVLPSVEYYIAALDAGGRVLASAGSEAQPLAIAVRVEARAAAPVYKRWWFWTVAGAILVGVVTAAVVATVATRGTPVVSPGTTDVTISFLP